MNKHFFIIISLYHQIVSTGNIRSHGISDVTKIGDKAEALAIALNKIAHIVIPIMRNLKGSNMEVTKTECFFFLHISHAGDQLLGHTIILVDTHMSSTGCIDGDIVFLTQSSK